MARAGARIRNTNRSFILLIQHRIIFRGGNIHPRIGMMRQRFDFSGVVFLFGHGGLFSGLFGDTAGHCKARGVFAANGMARQKRAARFSVNFPRMPAKIS